MNAPGHSPDSDSLSNPPDAENDSEDGSSQSRGFNLAPPAASSSAPIGSATAAPRVPAPITNGNLAASQTLTVGGGVRDELITLDEPVQFCARCGYRMQGLPLQAPCPQCNDTARVTAVERAEAAAKSRWGVLRHTHFRNVWIAAFVSNIGTWMEQVGVQMVVAKKTGSLAILGTLGAAQLLPILIFGIFGGLLADRVDRKKLLVITQFMLMATAAALALASYGGWATVPVLFAITIAQGIIMAFNFPAWQVLTPRLVPRDELTKAITMNGIQFNAARFVGPALAGVILGAWGATPLFVINTASFLAVLLAIFSTPRAPALLKDNKDAWRQIRDAAAFVFRQKGPRAVFLSMVVMSIFAAPLIRILPLYAIDVYKLQGAAADAAFGWLLGVLGLGAILGGIALRWIPAWYPRHHFIPLSLACCGVGISLISLTTTVHSGYVAMFICGIFWIWGFNQSWAALQHIVHDSMRGRVMAISNVFVFGVTALGNLSAGSIGEYLGHVTGSDASGTRLTVAGLGLSLLAAGIVMLTWRTPEIDNLNPGDPGFERKPGLLRGLFATAHAPKNNTSR